VSDDGAVELSWDPSAEAAYISLIPAGRRTYGVAADSVTFDEIAEAEAIAALQSLVHDLTRLDG
jgi:hypothetical protein